MDRMFENIKTITLRATFVCREDGVLPAYLGSTVRGILGHCIRDFYCHFENKNCYQCEEKESCPYVRYFSNTGGEAGAVNPYTLYVHERGKERWEVGDTCVFDLTLFGSAAEQAGVYLDAIQAAEHKGWGSARLAFRLAQVIDPESGKLIFAGGKHWFRNLTPRPLTVLGRNAEYASLFFDTPLRVVSGGRLFETLPFEVLIQFLIRRITLIAAKYTDASLDWDEEELLHHAGKVRIVEEYWREIPFTRYSMNQRDRKLELTSNMGWVLYEGNLSRFVPILEAGKCLRVGKGATIGFGHYEISYDKR